jgi:hypothetical protein
MSDAPSLIMVQFLAWVAERPRSYGETMDAWRTSCPRLSVWEDATLDGLVRRTPGPDGVTLVRLTASGRALLEAASPAPAGPALGPSKNSPNRVSQKA